MSLGNTTQECPYKNLPNGLEGPPEPPPQKIRVSLFFDGTLNNRVNVNAAILGLKPATADTSYANDFSNISKIEGCWDEDSVTDHSNSIYIEGIGTSNNKSDKFLSTALGTLSEGVTEKVNKGIKQIIKYIENLPIAKKKIEYIHLDSFGFSRGAAAARYFIYAALRKGQKTIYNQLIAQGYTIESGVQVKFVGLFDTVASEGFDHSNDTKVLHLDSINLADKVVQLAAAEEHRHNFPLTNINNASNGTQVFLPGTHSDIGGGYNDLMEENLTIFRISRLIDSELRERLLKIEKNRLSKQGWYNDDEIFIINNSKIEVTRKNISNKYSFIPLHIMAKFANDKGLNISVDGFPMPNADLDNLKQNLDNYISRVGASSSANDWINDNSNSMKSLRHDYLHFSAFYSRVEGDTQWEFVKSIAVKAIGPHEPADDRIRTIYDG